MIRNNIQRDPIFLSDIITMGLSSAVQTFTKENAVALSRLLQHPREDMGKFKFCSDGDCPLWALAALHALSSLPTQLFKKLVDTVADGQNDDQIMELLKYTNLTSREESARAAAVIRWTLHQSWCSNCSASQLTRDLLMLGVPRTHAVSLAQALEEAQPSALERDRMLNNFVTDITISEGPSGTIDAIAMTLTTPHGSRDEVLIDRATAKSLLDDLKRVYSKMDKMS